MKNLLCLLLISISAIVNGQNNAPSQDNTIDSIKSLIESTDIIDTKVKHYESLITNLIVKSHPEKMEYINELSTYSNKNNSILGKAFVHYAIGHDLLVKGQLDQAILEYDQAISLYKTSDHPKMLSKTVSNLSICYERKGNVDKALSIMNDLLPTILASDNNVAKFNTYKRIGEIYGYLLSEREKGLEYIDKAQRFLGDKDSKETTKNKAAVLLSKGTILTNYDNKRASKVLIEAERLAMSSDENSMLIYIRNVLEYLAHQDGRISDALEIVNRNLEMAIKANDKMLTADCYNKLGSLYATLGNVARSIENFDKAIAISEENDHILIYITATSGLGQLYNKELNYKKAIDLHEEALSLSDSLGLNHMIIQILPSLGTAHLEFGNHEQGKKIFERALGMIQGENESLLNRTHKGLGRYYIYKQDWKQAEEHLTLAYQVSENSGNITDKALNAELLAEVALGKKDYKNAYKWKNEYYTFTDSLNLVENQEKITTLQLTAEFDKEKEVIALKNEQEKALLKEKQLRTAIGGGLAGLALLLSLYFYRTLRRQKVELETLNNTKDTLFQIIGHDLKKPTIGFRNVSKNINYLLEKEDYNRLKKLGEEVDQDAKSLYSLTDNLLAWALVQKDTIKLRPTKVNVSELTRENIDLFEGIAKRKNISLVNDIAGSCLVNVDRNALDTIIRNLIDNAIKYTPSDGTITIRNKATGGIQSIFVEDTGNGMSKEVIKQIRNESYGSSTQGTEGEKGSGVGLQLVKSLVAKSKGEFSIENKPDQGVVVSINLPQAI